MKKTRPGTGKNARQGVALIVAIGLLTVLTLVAASFAVWIRLEHLLAAGFLNEAKARCAAEAGIERGLVILKNDADPVDSLNESWANGIVVTGTDGEVVSQYCYRTGVNPEKHLIGFALNPDLSQEKCFPIVAVDTLSRKIYTDPAAGPLLPNVGATALTFAVYWNRAGLGEGVVDKNSGSSPKTVFSGTCASVDESSLSVSAVPPAGEDWRWLVGGEMIFTDGNLPGLRSYRIVRVDPVTATVFTNPDDGNLQDDAVAGTHFLVRSGDGNLRFDLSYRRVEAWNRDRRRMESSGTQLDEIKDAAGVDRIRGHVVQGIVDEDRKININLAGQALLRSLFKGIGLTEGEADAVVTRRTNKGPFLTAAGIMQTDWTAAEAPYIFYGDDDGWTVGSIRDDHRLYLVNNTAGTGEDRGAGGIQDPVTSEWKVVFDGGIEDQITVATAPVVLNPPPKPFDPPGDRNLPDGGSNFGSPQYEAVFNRVPGIYDNGYASGSAPYYYVDVDFDGNGVEDFIDRNGDNQITWEQDRIGNQTDKYSEAIDINNYYYNSIPVNVNTAGRTVLRAVFGGIPTVTTTARDAAADAIIIYRAGPDKIEGTPDDNPFDGFDTVLGDGIDPKIRVDTLITSGLDLNGDGMIDVTEKNARVFPGGPRGEFEALITYLINGSYQGYGPQAYGPIGGPAADDIMDNANPEPYPDPYPDPAYPDYQAKQDAINADPVKAYTVHNGTPKVNCWTTSFKFDSGTFRIVAAGMVVRPATGEVKAKKKIEQIIWR